jgi:hypothetical protein
MLSKVQNKSSDRKSNKSLVPSGFSNLFSSKATTHDPNHDKPKNKTTTPPLTLSIHDTATTAHEVPNMSPGPGEYNVDSSPYNSRLGGSVPSPSLKTRTSPYNMFPGNDNPAPGAYETSKEHILGPRFANSTRRTFMDDIALKGESPGPGDHTPDARHTQSSNMEPPHSSWSRNGKREIFPLSETPGPGSYIPNSSMSSTGLTSSHSRGKSPGGGGGDEVKDNRMFSDIVRRAQELPGVGDYDVTTTNYNHRLSPAIKSPIPMAASSQEYVLFPVDSNPGPGTYKINDSNPASSVHTPKFNKGIRTTFIDDSLRETAHSPGPGMYVSSSNNSKSDSRGEWRDKTTAFDLWGKPPTSPSPDTYDPKLSLSRPATRIADFTSSTRGNYIEDSISDNRFKVAPGVYNEGMPPMFKRDPPKIQSRFKTKEIIPSARG